MTESIAGLTLCQMSRFLDAVRGQESPEWCSLDCRKSDTPEGPACPIPDDSTCSFLIGTTDSDVFEKRNMQHLTVLGIDAHRKLPDSGGVHESANMSASSQTLKEERVHYTYLVAQEIKLN